MPMPSNKGIIDPELKSALDALRAGIAAAAPAARLTELQKQVDALDIKLADKHGNYSQEPSLIDQLKSSEEVSRLLRDKKGSCILNFDAKTTSQILQTKTVLTEAGQGFQTTGVLPIERIPNITPEARQVLTVRDVLTARPTTMAVVDFVKVSSPLHIASPVAEASTKPENALQFASSSEKIRTIATWLPATRQILDDLTELNGFIMSSLPYYVNLAEEIELLSGDNTGEHLHGLIPQASAFNTGLLSATKGWNKIDIVGRVIQQITVAKEIQPTFIVLHPNDWYDMRLTKDSFGRYILGDPQSMVRPNIFGLSAVSTTSISNGTFLVGSGDPVASEIRDRMEMQVEISTQHADFFTLNQVAIRAEKRLALVVKRAASFLTGTFSSSPA
jgi:HK97 family phage major capsid protein